MLNFTREIKRDLPVPPKNDREAACALAGLIATGGSVNTTVPTVVFVSENERVAEYFMRLAERFGARPEVREAVFDPKREQDKLTLSCSNDDALRMIEAISDLDPVQLKEREAVFFARGAFLGGGSCTLPHGEAKTGYHLEFVFPSETLAEDFVCILESMDILAKLVSRGERSVVYFKSREVISDFLSLVGATSAIKKLDEVSAAREESNRRNRVENCTASNADRAAIASVIQVNAFSELEARGILATLPTPLRDTARARVECPELSLAELSERLGITKSCLSHRLRRLMNIYETEKKS